MSELLFFIFSAVEPNFLLSSNYEFLIPSLGLAALIWQQSGPRGFKEILSSFKHYEVCGGGVCKEDF